MSAGSEGLSNRVGRWRVLPESPPLGLPQLKPHSHLTQMASLQPSYTSQKEQERSNQPLDPLFTKTGVPDNEMAQKPTTPEMSKYKKPVTRRSRSVYPV